VFDFVEYCSAHGGYEGAAIEEGIDGDVFAAVVVEGDGVGEGDVV
jgi:hypothetical protein